MERRAELWLAQRSVTTRLNAFSSGDIGPTDSSTSRKAEQAGTAPGRAPSIALGPQRARSVAGSPARGSLEVPLERVLSLLLLLGTTVLPQLTAVMSRRRRNDTPTAVSGAVVVAMSKSMEKHG
jgi:hypothetical protein